jgi:nitrogen-specific signal transduction histidine kinase
MIRLAIEDTGPGIAPDVASRIFEPFFTTRATGTGLGLAVVKRIVDSHHGRVLFSALPGRGALFTLWLPLDEPSLGPAAHRDVAVDSGAPLAGLLDRDPGVTAASRTLP